jgi:hypothetical protein
VSIEASATHESEPEVVEEEKTKSEKILLSEIE